MDSPTPTLITGTKKFRLNTVLDYLCIIEYHNQLALHLVLQSSCGPKKPAPNIAEYADSVTFSFIESDNIHAHALLITDLLKLAPSAKQVQKFCYELTNAQIGIFEYSDSTDRTHECSQFAIGKHYTIDFKVSDVPILHPIIDGFCPALDQLYICFVLTPIYDGFKAITILGKDIELMEIRLINAHEDIAFLYLESKTTDYELIFGQQPQFDTIYVEECFSMFWAAAREITQSDADIIYYGNAEQIYSSWEL